MVGGTGQRVVVPKPGDSTWTPLSRLSDFVQVQWRTELAYDGGPDVVQHNSLWSGPRRQGEALRHPVAEAYFTGLVQCEVGASIGFVQISWHRHQGQLVAEQRGQAPSHGRRPGLAGREVRADVTTVETLLCRAYIERPTVSSRMQSEVGPGVCVSIEGVQPRFVRHRFNGSFVVEPRAGQPPEACGDDVAISHLAIVSPGPCHGARHAR